MHDVFLISWLVRGMMKVSAYRNETSPGTASVVEKSTGRFRAIYIPVISVLITQLQAHFNPLILIMAGLGVPVIIGLLFVP